MNIQRNLTVLRKADNEYKIYTSHHRRYTFGNITDLLDCVRDELFMEGIRGKLENQIKEIGKNDFVITFNVVAVKK